MSRSVLGGVVILIGLLAACGGRAREAEAGDGKAGTEGADACTTGKQRYAEHRTQLLQKLEAKACQADADCGVLWENNACVSTCGVNVLASEIDAASQDLEAFAKTSCGTCPPIPAPPCVPPRPVVCQQGRCGEG